MQTKRNTLIAILFVVVVAALSFTVAAAPVPINPVAHVVADNRTTGPVSITCIERDLWGYHNDDQATCGDGATKGAASNGTTSVTAIDPKTPIIIDEGGVVVDNGDGVPAPKVKSNNGNHYGNNTPDYNAKDVKNKHDGENSAADHHDEVKVKGNDKIK
jgi:hypothetical protein